MIRPAAALALLLCGLPAARGAEAPARDAQRAEVLRKMDRVIANPGDAGAKAGLGVSAGRAAAQERTDAEAERAALLEGAKKDYARLSAMQAERAARVEAWKKDFDRACSMASRASTVRAAVAEYESLLESFPVYSDSAALLEESGGRIRKIFYDTVRSAYPYLAAGRTTADARMLASLQFARASAQQAENGGGNFSGVAEAELRKADKLKSLEDQLARHLDDMTAGLALFRRRRWTDAVKYFDEVLAFDKTNEEAEYYKGLAVGRARTGDKR